MFFLALFLSSAGLLAADAALAKAFENSFIHEKSREYAKAVADFKGLNIDDSYEANLRLGWLLYCAGGYDSSISYYRKAARLMPYSEEAKFGLILPLAAQGSWDVAIEQYKAILAVSPNNTAANYRLGTVYYDRQDYEKALPYFRKFTDLYPFDYSGLLMYAWTNLKLGRTREAQALFNKVLLRSPRDTSALHGLQMLGIKPGN
jgi:tetratricopeptide (TPR) repeat protein